MKKGNHRAGAVIETERVLKQLRDLIEDKDVQILSLERQLALRRGYLSQVLNGYIELKYWHVTAILGALEVSPGDFLADLFPSPLLGSSDAKLELGKDGVVIYGIGIEAVRELRRRTLECERRLVELRDSGDLERLIAAAQTETRRS